MTPKTYKIVWEDGDNGSFRGEVVALSDYEALRVAFESYLNNVGYLEADAIKEVKRLTSAAKSRTLNPLTNKE